VQQKQSDTIQSGRLLRLAYIYETGPQRPDTTIPPCLGTTNIVWDGKSHDLPPLATN